MKLLPLWSFNKQSFPLDIEASFSDNRAPPVCQGSDLSNEQGAFTEELRLLLERDRVVVVRLSSSSCTTLQEESREDSKGSKLPGSLRTSSEWLEWAE